jgi:hypothetical protein
MKRNKALRVLSVFLVLLLVSTCAFSGSLAKYVGEAAGASWKARIAAFRVLVNDEDILTATGTDIFVAPTLSYTTTATPTKNENDPGTFDAIYAPGVGFTISGSLLTVKNLSEVDVDLAIELIGDDFDEDIPGSYSVDDGENWIKADGTGTGDSLYKVLDDLQQSGETLAALTGTNEDSIFSLQYKWEYDVDDASDLIDSNDYGAAAATALYEDLATEQDDVKSNNAGVGVFDLAFKISVTQAD